MKLKKEILSIILTDNVLQGRLMTETGKSFSTIRRWVKANSSDLTQYAVLSLLAHYLNKSIDDLLEQ